MPRIARDRDQRLALDSDGRYSIAGIHPRPSRLLVARIDSRGGYVPLASSIPGEDVVLSGGPLVIETPGMEWSCVSVSYKLGDYAGEGVACASGESSIAAGWFPEGSVSVRLVVADESFVDAETFVESGKTTELAIPGVMESK